MKRVTRTKKIEMFSLETYEGERIETKCARITENNEPISDGAEIIYTEKKDGVRPEFNIRTDKWDIALEAMDTVQRNRIAKAQDALKPNEPIEPTEPKQE